MSSDRSGARKKRKIVGIVLVVLGVVGFAAALALVFALAQTEAMLSNPEVQLRMAFQMSDAQRAEMSTVISLMRIGEIAAGAVGLVSLIVGIVLLVTLPKDE